MTKEERKLLLMDLCGRLPHEVMANIQLVENDNRIYKVDVHWLKDFIENNVVIKPYLRPINTITKSEIADAIKYICDTDNVVWSSGTDGVGFYFYKSDGIKRRFDEFKFKLGCYGPKNIDWLNEHHFDYRGLIEKGLALEAKEGMYKINMKKNRKNFV